MKSQKSMVVPKKFAGKWIAWNAGRSKIVASGGTLRAVAAEARQAGERQPAFEWVPPADRLIIGFAR